MNLLVSWCLLGEPCRYDGQSKPVPELKELEQRGHCLIPVCPEVLGGLPTPRPPAELQPDGRVVNREGADVTEEYQRGAELALALAKERGCTAAVLKEKSPTCGSTAVYDGTFSGRLIPGQGVAARLLEENGVRVLGESQIGQLLEEEKPRRT